MTPTDDLRRAMSWLKSGALSSGEGMVAGERAVMAHRAQVIARCFALHPEALQILLEMTVFRPPVDYRLPRADGRFENFALVREGHNQVAAAVLELIDLHDQLQRGEHELSQDDLALAGAHDGPGGDGDDGIAVR